MQRNLSNALHFFEEAGKKADQILFAFDIAAEKFLYLNPAFERLLNISVEDAFQKPASLLDLVHPEDKEHVIDAYNNIKDTVQIKEIEFRVFLSDNEQRWLSLNPYLIDGEQENMVVVGFARDISKEKDKDDVLKKFAAKKNSILEILSHDLAGPLTKIKGAASLLAEEAQQHNNPDLKKLVYMIEETNERSIRLIREFVKHEFIQSKNSSLVKERENIVERMKEVIEQYENSSENIHKKINFKTSSEKIYVNIDAYKFSQAVNNLISNAIKFTEDGGKITLSVEDRPESVLITVADDGIGIPVEYHENLFDKFTEARRPGLKGEPSVGLGMSVIKTIVEWHGGKISFESKENEGSTFFIELPKE